MSKKVHEFYSHLIVAVSLLLSDIEHKYTTQILLRVIFIMHVSIFLLHLFSNFWYMNAAKLQRCGLKVSPFSHFLNIHRNSGKCTLSVCHSKSMGRLSL